MVRWNTPWLSYYHLQMVILPTMAISYKYLDGAKIIIIIGEIPIKREADSGSGGAKVLPIFALGYAVPKLDLFHHVTACKIINVVNSGKA
jgi:hypothetical protein